MTDRATTRSPSPRSPSPRSPSPRQKFGARADLLDAETERRLIREWQSSRDERAADRLIRRYQPLVTGIARRYRGLGVAFDDLVAEGNTGLLRALDRFDPAHGARLSTYATWWIRAAVAESVLQGPIVRVVGSEQGRKLFFNLRRLKLKLGANGAGDLAPDVVTAIAKEVDVSEAEVIRVNRRLSLRDVSLNAPVPGTDGGSMEWQDVMPDPTASVEDRLVHRDQLDKRMALMETAMASLKPRERQIVAQRWLRDEPRSLADIGAEFGVTRERVRQIENMALRKLRSRMQEEARSAGLLTEPHPPTESAQARSMAPARRPRARPTAARAAAAPANMGGAGGHGTEIASL